MSKNILWKQETPQEQLVALLASQAGYISNLRDRIITDDILIKSTLAIIDGINAQLLQLVPYIKGTLKWDDNDDGFPQDYKLVITRRQDDFHVCPDGHSQFWDCGETQSKALGKWFNTHQRYTGIEITLADETSQSE